MRRVDSVRDLGQWLYHKRAPFPGAWLAPMQLPGLRAFWNHSTGLHWIDGSGQGRHLDVQYDVGQNSGCDISTAWPGAILGYVYVAGAPYPDHSAFEAFAGAGLEITGVLTVGVLVNVTTPAQDEALVYEVGFTPPDSFTEPRWYVAVKDGDFRFGIRGGGVHAYADAGIAIDGTTWYLVVGRYVPSTHAEVRVDRLDWVQDTTNIPAAITYGAPQEIMRAIVTNNSDPHLAQAWVCAYTVPDHFLDWLFAVQSPLFGKT